MKGPRAIAGNAGFSRAKAGSTGFSVVELIVVLAIAIALVAVAYPNLPALLSKYRLDSAAWNLATELQNVRQQAIGEATRYRVTFDTTNRTYRVQRETPRSSGVYVDDGPPRAIDDAGTVSIPSAPTPVFNSRGTCESGQGIITLAGSLHRDASPQRRLISVQFSGRVNVQ